MQHMEAYVAQVNGDPIGGLNDYLERYVYGPKSWTEYLSLIGMGEVLDATRRGRSIYDD